MERICINASESYDVLIGHGLLYQIGEEAGNLFSPCKILIVSEERIFSLYAKTLIQSLMCKGFTIYSYLHNGGEEAKSLSAYAEIQHFLCENKFTRHDAIFALGGGVTGDLAGFAAATYQRGIAFVQLPTTLLAAVDASIGGKTALNLPEAKNQIGCFYQPKAVFCDLDVLRSLDRDVYCCGCAEIIKYAVLGDAAFFAELEEIPIAQQEEQVIARCVAMKRDIIEADERDHGCRQLLNLGHTFGHAIERCSDYKTAHGDAVAIGMAMVLRGAAGKKICDKSDCERVIALLKKYRLPTECDFPAERIIDACTLDKKMMGDCIRLVVPQAIGRCAILPVDIRELRSWLD